MVLKQPAAAALQLPLRLALLAPVGRLAFPRQNFISKRERPRLLFVSGHLQEREENIHIIALQLFFVRKTQLISLHAGEMLKIVVNPSSGRASFFKATENLQDSLRC